VTRRRRPLSAVFPYTTLFRSNVSFDVERGRTLGIVGESGSGKSVCCYSLLGLVPMPPGRIEGGTALFEGRDLLRLEGEELRQVRDRKSTRLNSSHVKSSYAVS